MARLAISLVEVMLLDGIDRAKRKYSSHILKLVTWCIVYCVKLVIERNN